MTAVKFIASAGYLPNRIVTNEELSQFLEAYWNQTKALRN